MHHTMIHENVKKFMDGFHYDAHPMGILHQHRGGALHLLPGSAQHRTTPSAAASRLSG